jgi:hypothetical protein
MFFNAATGGSPLWTEDRTSVSLRRGSFSVDLGAVTEIPNSIFKNNENLYIHICFDANGQTGDGSGLCSGRYEENFSTRKRVDSVAWAYRALGLGPITINNAGDVAYDLDASGAAGTLAQFNFNGSQKAAISTGGLLSLSDSGRTFSFSPGAQRIDLTSASDIYFGSAGSLRGSATSNTSGAGLIGVFDDNFNIISGNDAQSVFESIDDLIGSGSNFWSLNGSSIFYNSGNVGIGTGSPTRNLDIAGVLRLRTTTEPGVPLVGDIYSDGSDLFFYNGSSWDDLTQGGLFTDGGATTYLTSLADNFAIGATDLTSGSFGVDDSGSAINFLAQTYELLSDRALFDNALAVGDPTGVIAGSDTAFDPAINGLYVSRANNGSNLYPIRSVASYDPTGTSGTGIFNGAYLTSEVTAGDGTNLSSFRGYRVNLTNNSTGTVSGMFPVSAVGVNNGTTANFYGGVFSVTNAGTNTSFFEGVSAQVTNSGDAVNVRGVEAVVNHSGTATEIIGVNSLVTNTSASTATLVTGYNTIVTHNGTGDVDNLQGFRGSVTNNQTTSTRLGAYQNVVTNNGTYNGLDSRAFTQIYTNASTGSIPQFYGAESVFTNDGTATNGWISNNNAFFNTGTIAAETTHADFNVDNTTGTIGGDLTGIKSSVSFGDVTGAVYGTQTLVGEFSGDSGVHTATSDIYGHYIEIYGSDTDAVSSGNHVYGTYSNILDNVSASGDIYGFYNDVSLGVSATYNNIYGIYSTDNTTEVWLNFQETYAIFTNGDVVVNGALCVDGGTGCPALSAGGIYGDLAYSEFDIAENILATSDVEVGMIVSAFAGESEVVRTSNGEYDTNIIGVVSTDPGVLGGYTLEEKNGYKVIPLALAGRVPLRVSGENGQINIGDPITSSSIKGYGMKATDPGKIVGYALSSFSGSGTGDIIVLLGPGYFLGDGVDFSGLNEDEATLLFDNLFSKKIITGSGMITAGSTQITISDSNILPSSKITLTPTTSTNGEILFVGSKNTGFFTVEIDKNIKQDILFDFIIVRE